MADNIMQVYNKQTKRKKALVIMNYRHAFLKDYEFYPEHGGLCENVGRYLADAYGDKVASVYIMGLAFPNSNNEYTLVKDGRWDALFEHTKKTNIGFNLKKSPFGSEAFDVFPADLVKEKFVYEDQFTGLIFYKPIQEHQLRYGWTGFITDDFVPEMQRRARIINEAMDLNMAEEQLDDWIPRVNYDYTTPYDNLDSLRKKIDFYKSGLK